jgi:hypothetical protein
VDEEVKKNSYRTTGRSIGAKLGLTIASTLSCEPPTDAAIARGRPATAAKARAIAKAVRSIQSPFLSLEYNVKVYRVKKKKY